MMDYYDEKDRRNARDMDILIEDMRALMLLLKRVMRYLTKQ